MGAPREGMRIKQEGRVRRGSVDEGVINRVGSEDDESAQNEGEEEEREGG